jgi:hypothetical protein
MASYAEPGDVSVRLGVDFSPAETSQATALLADVSEIMRARLPELDTWIADGLVTAELARAVACQVAMQAITVAGAGVGIRSETHPEYSVTFTDAATAGLDLTEAQRDLLTPKRQRNRPFSITPG